MGWWSMRPRHRTARTGRAMVPVSEVAAPAPAKESTVQHNSRYRFSVWATRLGVLANGAIALVVSVLAATGWVDEDRRPVPTAWAGLVLAFVGALVLEQRLLPDLPAIMHGHLSA